MGAGPPLFRETVGELAALEKRVNEGPAFKKG